MLVFAIGLGLSVAAGACWWALRGISEETKALARGGIRDGVKALGMEGKRLKPLGDWKERSQLLEMGHAHALVRIYPFVSRSGPPLLIVGLIGMLLSGD